MAAGVWTYPFGAFALLPWARRSLIVRGAWRAAEQRLRGWDVGGRAGIRNSGWWEGWRVGWEVAGPAGELVTESHHPLWVPVAERCRMGGADLGGLRACCRWDRAGYGGRVRDPNVSRSAAGQLSPERRAADLRRLRAERFDVLVIGGGVTGAGAALDAASRGLSGGPGRGPRPRRRHLQPVQQADPRRPALPGAVRVRTWSTRR